MWRRENLRVNCPSGYGELATIRVMERTSELVCWFVYQGIGTSVQPAVIPEILTVSNPS